MSERPRILFIVMSAVHTRETVDQLASSLAPHLVLVHHDFSQTPDFSLHAPNTAFVPEPKRTGWGTWGFSEAILHSLEFALREHEFDYLQLLSPTCLPIKPISAFEAHVSRPDRDAHFGAIDLLLDRDALMSVGYRAFSKRDTLRFRILRRLSRAYFSDASAVREVAGLWLHSGRAINGQGNPSVASRLALASILANSHSWLGRHVFDENLRPYFGSVWFGARHAVVSRLVERAADVRLRDSFREIQLPEEFLFASILMRASRSPGPMNHLVNSFDQANPRWLTDADFSKLEHSQAYFARKFVDDPSAPLRLRVLTELAGNAETDDSMLTLGADSP